jgi:hypothetical protein
LEDVVIPALQLLNTANEPLMGLVDVEETQSRPDMTKRQLQLPLTQIFHRGRNQPDPQRTCPILKMAKMAAKKCNEKKQREDETTFVKENTKKGRKQER